MGVIDEHMLQVNVCWCSFIMGCCFGRQRVSGLDEVDRLIGSNTFEESLPYSARVMSGGRRTPSIRLNLLDHRQCTVTWRQLQPVVGGLTVVDIRLVCGDGRPYTYSRTDYFQVHVLNAETEREVNCVIEPRGSLVGRSLITISFTVRVSGEYTVLFMINGQMLDRIHRQQYQAGPPDQSKTVFHLRAPNIIMRCSTFYPILFSPKDSFGNVATLNGNELVFETRKNSPDAPIVNVECVINEIDDDDERYELLVKLDQPGYYLCSVKHMDRIIGLSNAIAIVLTAKDMAKVENNCTTLFLNIGYRSRMIQSGNRSTKEVWCYLSPRMFQVRGYTFGVISKRLFTCRVCNSTQFVMHSSPEKFTVDDGLQPPVTLLSPEREVIAAVYYQFVQRNIGGSFQDKVRHFHEELRRQNDSENRLDIGIRVRRFELLESAMNATSSFTEDMWKRHFCVEFEGEAGIDIGGVSREFVNCLCDIMFSGRNPRGLFKGFKQDDMQSLVHPNYRKKRDKHYSLAHYRFAGLIVGKCLFDTAMGNRLLVRAKFTRSFLAQIIGLRLTWKHFETDDPDLYNFKIKNIKDGDLADLELSLNFAEEEFDSSTNDHKEISLTPGGTKIPVTESNKMDYLNELAQHRLGRRVSEEIREFLKGLHLLIPDELIGIFDENELELLMCGVQELSVDDLHAHTVVRHVSEQTVDWFWTAVEEFSQEELARLIQFVTGSSQIPSGGFAELRPPFILATSGERGNRLPYAHTCFNHLCLPECDSYEQFRTGLMTAINEGSEGIFMS